MAGKKQPARAKRKGDTTEDITNSLWGNTVDFHQTLIDTGKNQTLDPKSSFFWKGAARSEYKFNWQIPPVPALLLQSHNPPRNWRGPEFMEKMSYIYQTSSQNALRSLHETGGWNSSGGIMEEPE